jgi:hypothetical protein
MAEDELETPQDVYNEILLGPLSWPLKTVRLGRNSDVDYVNRDLSAAVSPAELYHVNSALYPEIVDELLASKTDVAALQRDFAARRALIAARGDLPVMPLPSLWTELLERVGDMTAQELWYAVDLRVAWDRMIGTFEPVQRRVSLLRRLSPSEYSALDRAPLLAHHPSQRPAPLLVVVLGVFSRNAVLFGERGYRRTLLEAGRAIEVITQACQTLDIPVRSSYEFEDHVVNAIAMADGVEAGALAVCRLGSEE